jgi:hypothetical protein
MCCDAKSGRPRLDPQVEHLTLRLIDEPVWGVFTDEERGVWLHAAADYFKLQRREGFKLTDAYLRVRAMLAAATRYEEAKEEVKSDAGGKD